MPIKMNKPGDTTFAITVEDRFDANEDAIVEIVDMDTRDDVSTIDGKPYTSIVWKYRIFDQDGVAFLDKVDGSAYEGWEFSSMALTPKAKARAWASAFLGHELSDEECDKIADNFDGAIVGKRARVSWKVEEKANGTRIRFALLRPLLTKATKPAAAPKTSAPTPPAANGPVRETAAERRARLQAELEAMDDQVDESAVADDDVPF
jgi:hypothetical protein